MELKEIVEKQREIYIKQLLEFYSNRSDGAKELLLSYSTDKPVMLLNLSRMDFILKNGDNWKIEEFSPDTYGEHPSIEFKYQDMTILLNPFFWHGCDFLIEPKTTDITFLENWTKKWIDEEELLNPLSNGLSGAIHSVTIPIHEENGLTFSIDFGSSMVDSFLSLIDIIQKSGFQKVSINSFQMINKNSD